MKTRIFKKTISFSLSASFLILNSCQPPIGNQVANRSQNQNSLKESNENSNHLKNDVDGFDSFFKKEQFQVSAQITENNGLIRIYGGPQDITDYQGDLKFNSSSALFESTEFSSKKPDIYYDIEISGATALPKFVSLSIGNIISPNPDVSTYTNNPGVGFYMFSQFFPREEYFTLNKIEQNTQLLTPPSQPYDPLNIWSCLGRYGSESLEYIPNEQLGYINTQFHADVKNYQDITPVFSRFEITGGKYTIERIRKLVGGKEKEFFKISITDIQSGKSSGKHDGSAMWNCLSNVGSFSGSISFLIPIPDLALSITPVVLKGEDDNKQSRIKVIDVDGIKPWTLKITPITGSSVLSNNVDKACLPPNGGPIYVKQGVGNVDFNWPEIPHTLGNGVYDVELHYDDAQPGEGQFATVKVDYPIEVKLSKDAQSPFDPRNGESTSFDVKAPGCPEWALRVTGTHDSVFANVPGSACTWQDFFGQTANQSDLYWNGFCTADNPQQPNPQNPFPPSPLQLITPGSYDVNLYFKQKDDTYSTISAASTSVTVGSGFYCPPGQTCASPSPGGGPGSSPSPGASPGTGPSGSPSSGPSGSPIIPSPSTSPIASSSPSLPDPESTSNPNLKPINLNLTIETKITKSKKIDENSGEIIEEEMSNEITNFATLQTKVSTRNFRVGNGNFVELGGKINVKRNKNEQVENIAIVTAEGTAELFAPDGKKVPGYILKFNFSSEDPDAEVDVENWYGRWNNGAGHKFVPTGKYILMGKLDPTKTKIKYKSNYRPPILISYLNLDQSVDVTNDFPAYSEELSTPKEFTNDSIKHILERHKRDYLSKDQHLFFFNAIDEMRKKIKEQWRKKPNQPENYYTVALGHSAGSALNQIYGENTKDGNQLRKAMCFPDDQAGFNSNKVLNLISEVANMKMPIDKWKAGTEYPTTRSIELRGQRLGLDISAASYYNDPALNQDKIIRTGYPNLPKTSPLHPNVMKSSYYHVKICDPLFNPQKPLDLHKRYFSFTATEEAQWKAQCFSNLQQFVPYGQR